MLMKSSGWQMQRATCRWYGAKPVSKVYSRSFRRVKRFQFGHSSGKAGGALLMLGFFLRSPGTERRFR